MRRLLGVCGAALAALAVAVPVALAADGPKTTDRPAPKPAVQCTRTSFGGRILLVGATSVSIRIGGTDGRKIVVQLNGDPVIKRGGVVVDDVGARTPGAQARFYVRICRVGRPAYGDGEADRAQGDRQRRWQHKRGNASGGPDARHRDMRAG